MPEKPNRAPPPGDLRTIVEQFTEGDQVLPRAWGRRDTWQVRLRWWVPPAIAAGVLVSRWMGFELEVLPVLLVALFVFAYNLAFARVFTRMKEPDEEAHLDRRYAIFQVSLDYAAIFLLIHYTGGPESPLIFFFILHVIIAAILFRSSNAWLFAAVATVGMVLLAGAEYLGWLSYHPVRFRGEAIGLIEHPGHILALLLFFTASVLTTAALTTAIMRRLRERVQNLALMSGQVAALNEKLNSLYAMLGTVGSERRLERILDMVTSELAKVMGVAGVAVKLLSDDGKTLSFAAAHGLAREFAEETVEVAKSPLNRRVIEGETLVFGQVAEDHTFQLQDDLVAAGIRSVVFAPLHLEDRVIGILGAYCQKPDCFTRDDTSFFRLAAELVAIAIENARAYGAVQDLMKERSRFMLQVAHNMRAPLTSALSMLGLVREGYLGEIDRKQADHLERVGRRLENLSTTVQELLTLAKNREGVTDLQLAPVSLSSLAERIERTFRDEATRRGITLRVGVEKDLPEVLGDARMLEQMMENLVSNALKYTPCQGRVDLIFAGENDHRVKIEVRDTGIGIPPDEQSSLFGEFFRASNARKLVEDGTGLGLAIVKQIVDRHQGRIRLQSEQGQGTTVIVELPVRRP